MSSRFQPSSNSALIQRISSEGAEYAVALAASENPAETLISLSDEDTATLWQHIARLTAEALDEACPAMGVEPADGESEDSAAVESALAMLLAATHLAHATISDDNRVAPPDLIDVATALHDIIFDLQDPRASQLQVAIVELCEAWYLDDRPERAGLVPQTISYLLVRVLHESATVADVKRLYAFRSSLQILDFADESVGPLKRLLLHCVVRPLILRCADGRRLVTYLFGLHAPFVAELHRAIKSQIPTCKKVQRECYGEVYF